MREYERLHDKRIPLDQLKERGLYRLHSRNLALGVYVADKQGFIGIRTKFGSRFLFMEFHYDCEQFATASPLELFDDELPGEIPALEFLSNHEKNQALFDWLDDMEKKYVRKNQ